MDIVVILLMRHKAGCRIFDAQVELTQWLLNVQCGRRWTTLTFGTYLFYHYLATSISFSKKLAIFQHLTKVGWKYSSLLKAKFQ